MDNIPLFSLPKVVVLPGIVLPFHIFEPRYVQMVENILKKPPSYIAMSKMNPKDDVDYFLTPNFEEVGCLTEVLEHTKNNDGTYEILVIGLERISIKETTSSDQNLYRCVDIDVKPYHDPNGDLDNFLKEYRNQLLKECENTEIQDDLKRLLQKFDEGMLTARACLHIIIYFFTKDPIQLQELLNNNSNESLTGLVLDLT
jgi:Lon protease-like protein